MDPRADEGQFPDWWPDGSKADAQTPGLTEEERGEPSLMDILPECFVLARDLPLVCPCPGLDGPEGGANGVLSVDGEPGTQVDITVGPGSDPDGDLPRSPSLAPGTQFLLSEHVQVRPSVGVRSASAASAAGGGRVPRASAGSSGTFGGFLTALLVGVAAAVVLVLRLL